MEINKDNIAEVLTSDEYKNDILPLITASDSVQSLITNKADSIYKEKIGDEVATIHKQYDDDMFEALGERPGTIEGGARMKTYTKIKELYSELSGLRTQKESLTKDAEVIRLNGEIDKLKLEGGGSHIQSMFDQAKSDWTTKEQGYLKQIQDGSANNDTFKKETAIAHAMQQIKFNPDTPESIKKMVLNNVEKDLIKNSKFEGDKLIFLNGEGKPAMNTTTYVPMNAVEMLNSMDAIKDISVKAIDKPGGGADRTIVGSIQTANVEGKDVKKLILQEGSFKTKEEFQKVAQKAILDSGITRRDQQFQKLIDGAYSEYKVADMPRN